MSQRRAAALPVLTLQASTQESDIGYENSRNPNSRTGVVGLSVSLPLFAGGAIVASAALMYQTGVLDDASVTRLSALLTREVRFQ